MRRLFAMLMLAILAVLGAAPAASAAQGVKAPPVNITIEDTAGILYQPQLLPALQDIKFHQPTTVAVYTRRGNYSDNFNEEVLKYAKANHPEWLSADRQKWADGLFIFAVDPDGRHVGTYMGEDRKVSLDQRESIQDASKELFRDAQWTSGTIAGVKKGASLINQPWYQSTAFVITSSIVGVGGFIGFGSWAAVRAANRRKAAEAFKRGDAAYASVSLALDETELNAKTIPVTSTYGGMVREKYRKFSTTYYQVGELSNQVHAFTKKELSEGFNVKKVLDYADLAQQMDAMDDVIADTNTLLNKFSGWGAAWDRQAQPFADDLARLPALLQRKEARGLPTAEALQSLMTQRTQGLQQLAADFHAGLITPEAALDNLREMREELTSRLQQHADLLISRYAKSQSETTAMRQAMDRRRKRDYTPTATIFGTIYGWNHFYTVDTFSLGYSDGVSQVSSSRSSSSGSSSTGYGSSGGSFSGSGSSSHF